MGRPKMDDNEKKQDITIKLSPQILERLKAAFPKMQRAIHVENALREYLDRHEGVGNFAIPSSSKIDHTRSSKKRV